jgi:hypothetical protein
MKIKDCIFRHPNVHGVPSEGLCRLRLFQRSDGLVIAVLTELYSASTGAAVELCATLIYRALVERNEIASNTPIIRHVLGHIPEFPVDCAWMFFDSDTSPTWKGLGLRQAAQILECDEAELTHDTKDSPALLADIERLRREILSSPGRT